MLSYPPILIVLCNRFTSRRTKKGTLLNVNFVPFSSFSLGCYVFAAPRFLCGLALLDHYNLRSPFSQQFFFFFLQRNWGQEKKSNGEREKRSFAVDECTRDIQEDKEEVLQWMNALKISKKIMIKSLATTKTRSH